MPQHSVAVASLILRKVLSVEVDSGRDRIGQLHQCESIVPGVKELLHAFARVAGVELPFWSRRIASWVYSLFLLV
jgi:hypothetical protein